MVGFAVGDVVACAHLSEQIYRHFCNIEKRNTGSGCFQDIRLLQGSLAEFETLLKLAEGDFVMREEDQKVPVNANEQLRELVRKTQSTVDTVLGFLDTLGQEGRFSLETRTSHSVKINILLQHWQVYEQYFALPYDLAKLIRTYRISTCLQAQARYSRSITPTAIHHDGGLETCQTHPTVYFNVDSTKHGQKPFSILVLLETGRSDFDIKATSNIMWNDALCIDQFHSADRAPKIATILHHIYGKAGHAKEWYFESLKPALEGRFIRDEVLATFVLLKYDGKATQRAISMPKLTSSIVAALTSFACGVCMHNFDAMHHEEHFVHIPTFMPSELSFIENPPAQVFVAATLIHGIATLGYYALRRSEKFREHYLMAGVLGGTVAGLCIGRSVQSVLVGILPMVIITSLLLCTATNTLLQNFRKHKSWNTGGKNDLEWQGK